MQYQYGGGLSVLYSNKTVGLNVWTHVALVYDAFSGVAKWYLNGTEQGSKNVGLGKAWDGPWCIGRMTPDYATHEWNGMIDEFRIYKDEARTQKEIQDDMKTSIAYKLTLIGLAPNSDVVQLWYPNGAFARAHMLQKTADANGQVEFNVYSFSGRSPLYTGIFRVVRSGRTYSSSILNFSWGDVYHFSLHTFFNEILIAALISALIITVPSALFITHRHMRSRHKTS
jgi:hypothetical protein